MSSNPKDPQARRSQALFRTAVAALATASLALGLYFLRFGRVNHDEGWYLYAARLVWEGELPYRDFAFFQAPVLPYLYGLVQRLFGSGLESGRVTSLALSAGTVALGARLAYQTGGRLASLLFLAFLSLTPIEIWSFTTTRTEPLTAFWLVLCAFLLSREPPRAATSSGALLAATLAFGTRISSLPFLGVVLCWVWTRHFRSRRELASVLLPSALVILALAALVFAAGWDASFFCLFEHASGRHAQLAPAVPWTILDFLERRLRDVAVLHAYYGVVPALAAAAGLAAIPLARAAGARRPAVTVLQVSALGLVAYVPNLFPRAVFPLYFAAVLPLFAIAAASALGGLYERAAGAGRAAVLAVASALLLFQVANFAERVDAQISERPDLPRIRAAAGYLAQVVPAGASLATMETYLAVESGLRVAPGWEMGVFSYFPARSDRDVRRFNVLNDRTISEDLRSDAIGAVVVSDYAIGVLVDHTWGGSGRGLRKEAELRAALPELEGYRLARVFSNFGQSRDHLYVFLPSRR